MNSHETAQEKKFYNSPTFWVYGTVRELTQAKAAGSKNDSSPPSKTA